MILRCRLLTDSTCTTFRVSLSTLLSKAHVRVRTRTHTPPFEAIADGGRKFNMSAGFVTQAAPAGRGVGWRTGWRECGGGRWGGGLIDAEGNCWEQLPSTITRPGNCWRNNYPNNYPQQLPPNANGVYARSEFQVRVIG